MSLNKEIYKRIKIAGLIIFIPIMMATGPVAGFFLGNYLHKRFGIGHYVIFLAITAGFLSGFFETIKIIKLATKTEKEK